MENKELGNTAVCMEGYAWKRKGLDTLTEISAQRSSRQINEIRHKYICDPTIGSSGIPRLHFLHRRRHILTPKMTAAMRLRPGSITPIAICPRTLSPLPPPLPPPLLLAADVEDDGGDDSEEDNGESDGSVECAVGELGGTSCVDVDVAEVEGDTAVNIEVLEDDADKFSDIGDTDVEEVDVEDAATDALSDGTHGQSTLYEPIPKLVHVPFGASVGLLEQ